MGRVTGSWGAPTVVDWPPGRQWPVPIRDPTCAGELEGNDRRADDHRAQHAVQCMAGRGLVAGCFLAERRETLAGGATSCWARQLSKAHAWAEAAGVKLAVG